MESSKQNSAVGRSAFESTSCATPVAAVSASGELIMLTSMPSRSASAVTWMAAGAHGVDAVRAIRRAWLGRGQHPYSTVAELVQMLQGQCDPSAVVEHYLTSGLPT